MGTANNRFTPLVANKLPHKTEKNGAMNPLQIVAVKNIKTENIVQLGR